MDVLRSFFLLLIFLNLSTAANSLQSLRRSQFIIDDGNDTTLVSPSATFELGFFTPGNNSGNRYLGIWYKNIPDKTVVWVANRENPINVSSSAAAVLTMNSSGNLVLTQNNTLLWYTNFTSQAQNPVSQLLDSGNLVLIDENQANPEDYLWQSFDYPSDTLLPGMKFGWNFKIGLTWQLTAWKSPVDPSPGDFTNIPVLNSYHDVYLMKGTKKFYRFGPWNGVQASGSPELNPNSVFEYTLVSNADEFYFMYTLMNTSVLTRLVVNQTDSARYRYVWVEDTQKWTVYSKKPVDFCDTYNLCGPNGNCIVSDSPVCQCLNGFTPKWPQKWNSVDWSGGCVRKKPLNCSEKDTDGFVRFKGTKVPETTYTWLDATLNLEQCRKLCLDNCSCMAYSNSNITGGGSGCVLWFGDLIDIRQYTSGGQDLYVRMSASELESGMGTRKKLIIILPIIIVVILGMLSAGSYLIYRKRKEKSEFVKDQIQNNDDHEGSEDDLGLPLFALSTLEFATDNFSKRNKIGEGGFGPVYWGKLLDGQEIAVKRLSQSSGQGLGEFKNEVKFIVKLQHRNLVRLLGCCIEGQEKMLVYEYMPNKSLDSFIFDNNKRKLLDWSTRYQIILGIGRGLMYLHQDSRLRIIHRDLKASNILLDYKLTPKISDFGLAKTFGEEQTQGNTNRVVGTYGYMAPEYAADGLYSVKSDVFSYGILVMEIICGKKNRGFYLQDYMHNLIGHAWMLWKEGTVLELVDENIKEKCNLSEVLRCIHVSLLCVQQNQYDRPNIASAVLMMESEMEMAEPKQPGFFREKDSIPPHLSYSSQNQFSSTNEITMTLIDAR